jgi:hypothetical protein
LKDISSLIIHHYQNYCDGYNLLSFEQFFEFFKDFGLYPDMVNLTQLKEIFYFLAEEFTLSLDNLNDVAQSQSKKITIDRQLDNLDQNLISYDIIKSLTTRENFKSIEMSISESKEVKKIKYKIAKNEKINFYCFLEALGVVSYNIKYNDNFNQVDRVLYLIEKMNRSKGINKSLMKTGQNL